MRQPGLKLVALEHPEFIENPAYVRGGSEPFWIMSKGAPLKEGNYRLFYADAEGRPFTNASGTPVRLIPLTPCEHLLLEIGDHRYRVDVSHVPNGAGIGEASLHRLLDCVALQRAWSQDMACRLILRRNGDDVAASEPVWIKTPVPPWTQALEPELFAQDPAIRYCGDLEKGILKGRILRPYAGRLFFTFNDALETDLTLRGFAWVGLVGNVYGVPPSAAYVNAEAMALTLNGTAFDWVDRPKAGRTALRARDSAVDNADAEGRDENDFVTMSRSALLRFMKSAQARAGTYMIWMSGHAGLIRNGVLYECKPPSNGFTKETYTPGEQSAVRRFDASQLATQLLKTGPYYLSKLPG